VFGWWTPAYWRDIGSLAAYRAAHDDLLDGRARTPLSPPGALHEGAWLSAGVVRGTDARVDAPGVIGEAVELGPGARIGPGVVIGPRSRIGAGARLRSAVLWEGVEVGEGAHLEACVVGAHAKIGAHARVGPDAVVESEAVVADFASR
jgi:NDP-sugar pyrophosphorylase family protein